MRISISNMPNQHATKMVDFPRLDGGLNLWEMDYRINRNQSPEMKNLWWQDGVRGIDYSRKEAFQWISLIRFPDFVTKQEFDWAVAEATRKKKTDFSKVEYLTYHEGLCVQCMHIGPFDNEPVTIQAMREFAAKEGYEIDITDSRYHHEIYLSDARKVSPEKLKTVIRHPIRKR